MPALIEQLDAHGGTDLDFRRKLAAKAYATTAAYDVAISTWFARVDQERGLSASAARCRRS